MNQIIGLIILQCLFLAIAVDGAPEKVAEQVPDFFSVTANQVTEMIRKQLMNSFANESSTRIKRAEQGSDEGSFPRPEFHYSSLRAEASGSGIPSPTMFVGGFSFMMMPTPEGEQIFNRIMEALPNLPNAAG